ncbi:hypothetical protein HYV73_02965 [Candidatus Uhrbacteria bacterium]|nr:hypothetical protein [Candidatus Uhrbacteria bacterium]
MWSKRLRNNGTTSGILVGLTILILGGFFPSFTQAAARLDREPLDPSSATSSGLYCACFYTKTMDAGNHVGVCEPSVQPDAPACTDNCLALSGGHYDRVETAPNTSNSKAVQLEASCAGYGQTVAESIVDQTKPKPIVPSFIPPSLNVPIPNLNFSAIVDKGGSLQINFIGEYFKAVYEYLLGISLVVATVMFIIGGFQYTLSALASSQAAKGKERMKQAAIGVVLLMSTYLILYTVNPSLVFFKPLNLSKVAGILIEEQIDGSGSDRNREPDRKRNGNRSCPVGYTPAD